MNSVFFFPDPLIPYMKQAAASTRNTSSSLSLSVPRDGKAASKPGLGPTPPRPPPLPAATGGGGGGLVPRLRALRPRSRGEDQASVEELHHRPPRQAPRQGPQAPLRPPAVLQRARPPKPRPRPKDRFGENGSKSTSVGSKSHGKAEDKTDAAFSEELRLISRDKCKILRENGLQNLEERQPLEKSPQAVGTSSSVCYPKKDKQRFSNCKLSDIGCPKTVPSSQAGKNLSRRLSKRRRVSTYRGAKNWEFEEVQHVVLLDDDVQPICPIQGGDTSENWEEYKIYYPSRGDPECVELSYSDLKCLAPESYLSSPIMNFYIQYLQRSSSPMAKRNGDCYIFNTFFYSKLEEAMTCKDRTASFLKLRRWWKGVDIFQKAYIILPIHGDMHWSLAIICIPAKEDESGPIILHLDSLGLHSSSHIFYIVVSYLKEEWIYIYQNAAPQDVPISERIWKNLPRRIKKEKITVPQQKNEYDCGLFVLYFMERFIEEAPERLRKKDFSMFGRKWFQPEDASGLRNKVREVLIKEFESNMLEDGIHESYASSSASENDDQL